MSNHPCPCGGSCACHGGNGAFPTPCDVAGGCGSVRSEPDGASAACGRADHRPDAVHAVCSVPLRCHRGKACVGAVQVTTPTSSGRDRRFKVAAVAERPLCEGCERGVAQVLVDVPRLFVDLEQAMPHRSSGGGRGTRASGPLGSPMLTNGRVLHLQETVHQLLVIWEAAVRDTAGLSRVDRRGEDPWERTKRRPQAGRETQAAASLLSSYLTVWITHPEIEYAVTQSNADPEDPRAAPRLDIPVYVTEAGWQAAARLLDWRSRVRSSLGLTRSVVRRDEPCMYCEVKAVVETAGDDLIRCEACGRTWPREEYHAKVRGFEPYLRKLAKKSPSKGAVKA